MNFNKNVEETLLELLESDAEFKHAFEGKIKEKIMDELDNVDFNNLITRAVTNMIDYMFTHDDYVYEDIRDAVSSVIANNVKIGIIGKEFGLNGETTVENER